MLPMMMPAVNAPWRWGDSTSREAHANEDADVDGIPRLHATGEGEKLEGGVDLRLWRLLLGIR